MAKEFQGLFQLILVHFKQTQRDIEKKMIECKYLKLDVKSHGLFLE